MRPNYSNLNRRDGARAQRRLHLTAIIDGKAREFRTVDVSCSGALVERSSERTPPLVHAVELTLDTGAVIKAYARTVWSSGCRHALRFVGLGDVDRLEIAELLDRCHATA